jgi:hypothetical protein
MWEAFIFYFSSEKPAKIPPNFSDIRNVALEQT